MLGLGSLLQYTEDLKKQTALAVNLGLVFHSEYLSLPQEHSL